MILAAAETLIRRRKPGVDRFGKAIAGEPSDVTVEGCVVWPRSSDERTFGQQTVSEDLTVLAPAGTEVLPTDQWVWQEELYDTSGLPFDWNSELTGTQAGVEFHIARSSG